LLTFAVTVEALKADEYKICCQCI